MFLKNFRFTSINRNIEVIQKIVLEEKHVVAIYQPWVSVIFGHIQPLFNFYRKMNAAVNLEDKKTSISIPISNQDSLSTIKRDGNHQSWLEYDLGTWVSL